MKKILAFILSIAVLLTMATTVFASERTTFEIESKDYYDINEPIDITITTADSYSSAEIWVDDAQVASYEGGSAGTIADELDLDGKVNSIGKVKFIAKVYYGDGVEEVSKDVLITKLADSVNAFNEDFSAANSVYCKFLYNIGGNGPFQAHTFEDGNKTIKYVFDSSYKVDSQVFLSYDGMKIPKGSFITVQFDIYFSSNDCYFIFETRYFDETTKKNEYPKNGTGTLPAITLFTKSDQTIGGKTFYPETWYTCKYEIDTINKGLKIYMKERNAAEFTLAKSYPDYVSYGLNHIRPVFHCTTNTGAFAAVDNFSVDYIGAVPQWYVKPSFKGADGLDTSADKMPVEGGKINLAFSKGMEYADGSYKLVNEVGDVVEADASFNSETFAGVLAPVKLRYNSKYSLVFNEGFKSFDGYGPLRERKIDLATVKYPVNIESVTKTTGGVNIVVANPDLCTTEVVSVACYNSNGALTEFNTASVPVSGNLFVALSNSSASDKIVVYVTDSVNSKIIYEVYEVK